MNRQLSSLFLCVILAGCASGAGEGAHSTATTTSTATTNVNSGVGMETPTSAGILFAQPTAVIDGVAIGASHWKDGDAAIGGQGQTVTGFSCAATGNANDIYTYTHLSIFLNGQQLAIPQNIGVIAPTMDWQTGCAYPLRTDDVSGKIRINSAAVRSPTLGQFFAIWGQPLSSSNVAGITNQALTVYINDGGMVSQYTGDLSAIELKPQREITIQLGTPLAQLPTYHWTNPPPLASTQIVVADTTLGTPNPNWVNSDTEAGGHGQMVDGFPCLPDMAETFHVHPHLSIFKGGQRLAIPALIGIPHGCYYSLHTHDSSGVLHVEAPTLTHFTLGQFFDIWGQPLSATNVAGITGEPIVFYINDGGDVRRYTGNPADIEMKSHRSITIQIGTPLSELPTYSLYYNK